MAARVDTFDLGRLTLSPGEGRRLDLVVRVEGFEFDRKIRAIDFDDEVTPQVNSILVQNRDLIAKLDAIAKTKSFDQAAPIYEAFLKDRRTAVQAINKLADEA